MEPEWRVSDSTRPLRRVDEAEDDPTRQGLVRYLNMDGARWRVMMRIRSEGEGWWRGRLCFSEAGSTEVWDQEEFLAGSVEELMSQAHGLSGEQLELRFRHSYDERRRFYHLRILVDELIEKARTVNRVVRREEAGELPGGRAGLELDRLQAEMHKLVDGVRSLAGLEGRERPE